MTNFTLATYLILLFFLAIYILLKLIDKSSDYIVVDFFGKDKNQRKTTSLERKAIFKQKLLMKWISFIGLVATLLFSFGLGYWIIINHITDKDLVNTGIKIAGGFGLSGGFALLFKKTSREAKDLE